MFSGVASEVVAVLARSIVDIGGYLTLCFTGNRVPVRLSSEIKKQLIWVRVRARASLKGEIINDVLFGCLV